MLFTWWQVRQFFARIYALALLCLALGSGAAWAQETPSGAAFIPAESSVTTRLFGDVDVVLAFSGPVPYRVAMSAGAPRLVLDFKGAHWGSGLSGFDLSSRAVMGARTGVAESDWARFVLAFKHPMRIARSQMHVSDEGAVLEMRLTQGTPQSVTAFEGALLPAPKAVTEAALTRPIIAIDAGHGGIDPGAIEDGVQEKNVVLTFARELARAINATQRADAVLVRDSDTFLGLSERVDRARAAGATAFLSIHADKIDDPDAHGATVYTLSKGTADGLSQRLAAQQNRALMIQGADLTGSGDDVTGALIDMALRDSLPRSERLAQHLTEAIANVYGERRRRDHLSAGFQVLTAPDFPSALIELGFMSHEGDRARFQSDQWRGEMAQAIAAAVLGWVEEDRADTARRLR
ncbi:N-acetylmuramoyl-L-alanine amidase [Paracoccaceae bacterium GXU_MW_L88]